VVRASAIAIAVYVGLLALTGWQFVTAPAGFIPQQDKGYLILNVQLPDAAAVDRTQRIVDRIEQVALTTPGVEHTLSVAGRSLILNANAPNMASMYVILKEFGERSRAGLTAGVIAQNLQRRCQKEARAGLVTAFGGPPIEGLGTTGGFKIIIEDRGGLGLEVLQQVTEKIVDRGNRSQGLTGMFSGSRASTPWIYLDIDRTKCMALGIAVSDVFNTLQVYLGSFYVNNFNNFGRTWQVVIQADQQFRNDIDQIRKLQVRNNQGQMVRLATLMDVRDTAGPVMLLQYNLYSAAAITGDAAAGTSSGQAMRLVEQVANAELPRSMSYDWTELSYLQRQAGDTTLVAFGLAVVFVFMVLAALYESWGLPLAVILVVPLCLLCSLAGVEIAASEVTIFTQIAFVVLVGLASKNAILIVEFARQLQDAGVSRWEATLEASRLRLRPIVMTSFAFILGVVPLVMATGAGSEMRRALGLAVFSGMLGVTLFGVFLTPVFYYVIRGFDEGRKQVAPPPA
jgi:multidrug efflux pump